MVESSKKLILHDTGPLNGIIICAVDCAILQAMYIKLWAAIIFKLKTQYAAAKASGIVADIIVDK